MPQERRHISTARRTVAVKPPVMNTQAGKSVHVTQRDSIDIDIDIDRNRILCIVAIKLQCIYYSIPHYLFNISYYLTAVCIFIYIFNIFMYAYISRNSHIINISDTLYL